MTTALKNPTEILLQPGSQPLVGNGTAIGDGDASEDLSFIDEVYNQILLRIIRGEYSGGTVLTGTRLADELRVSRTPVVAALDRLVADGILQKERNRRAVVRNGAEQWLLQVHQLRELLEPPAAALAATRIPTEVVEKLKVLADAADPDRVTEWLSPARAFDYALHLSIADHCGNMPLQKAIYKCWSYKRLSYEAGHNDPGSWEVGYHEHIAILNALATRDPATASAAMMFHLRSAAILTTGLRII
jgi:DNA-binding GntR family transcriptional regulator